MPYAVENELLLREVFEFCPEYQSRFIPFVSIDPGREVKAQISKLKELDKKFPIYGIKINPVLCQSKVTELQGCGRDFLDLAREKNWPFLLHTTQNSAEEYSNAKMTFEVIEKNPDLRICLAHCIGFHRGYLDLADQFENVWVDTSALKIQTQLAYEGSEIMASPSDRIEADFSDHKKVMQALVEQFPDTIIWGSDTPAYSYICRRKQAENVYSQFQLKASYEDEIAALNALAGSLKIKVSNENSLDFLFGKCSK